MRCPNCNASLEENTQFCGNCGKFLAPFSAESSASAEAEDTVFIKDDKEHLAATEYSSAPSTPRSLWLQLPTLQHRAQDDTHPSFLPKGRQLVSSHTMRMRRNIFLALLFVLLLVVASTGTLALLKGTTSRYPAPSSTSAPLIAASGSVSFSDSPNSQRQTDALAIRVSGLKTSAAGSHYDGWMVNEGNEQILALGQLTAQGQNYSLSFAGKGTNLIGFGNKIEVTQEQGTVTLPSGKVVLAGTFPPAAFVHIRHLLFRFPTTPGQIGLLVGLSDQTQQLVAQALLLKGLAASHDPLAMRCVAQTVVDVVEGIRGLQNLPWATACASFGIAEVGDGFGLLGKGYIATSAAHAALAATQSDSTDTIKTHAKHVEIATENIKGWVTTIDQDAQRLVANPNDRSKVQEIVTLAHQALSGVDINGDERVDPVPGEAGADVAYTHGHLMAALPLVAALS